MDFSASPPIPIKKTLVLVNNFIIDTTRFLNHFASLAEQKLLKVNHDVSRIETALVLLESRLQRIEGLPDATVEYIPTSASIAAGANAAAALPPAPATPAATPAPAPPVASTPAVSGSAPAAAAAAVPPPPVEDAAPVATMRTHPSYTKFYKLAAMNIPPEQLRMRMVAEGLNPALLDTPDAPITAAGGSGAATDEQAPPPASAAAQPPPMPPTAAPLLPPMPQPAAAAAAPPPPAAEAAGGGGGMIKDDPRYAPFYKMLRMGVPLGAVMQKAALVPGVNPALVANDPESPAPP